MSKVAIVDFGMGNLFSVSQACKQVGLDATVTHSPEEVEAADALIFPGVGAFGKAMNNLDESGLTPAIKNSINGGKPFLGICLGMQLLFSQSEEFGSHKGLDIFKGTHGTLLLFDTSTNGSQSR